MHLSGSTNMQSINMAELLILKEEMGVGSWMYYNNYRLFIVLDTY